MRRIYLTIQLSNLRDLHSIHFLYIRVYDFNTNKSRQVKYLFTLYITEYSMLLNV